MRRSARGKPLAPGRRFPPERDNSWDVEVIDRFAADIGAVSGPLSLAERDAVPAVLDSPDDDAVYGAWSGDCTWSRPLPPMATSSSCKRATARGSSGYSPGDSMLSGRRRRRRTLVRGSHDVPTGIPAGQSIRKRYLERRSLGRPLPTDHVRKRVDSRTPDCGLPAKRPSERQDPHRETAR
jgi:hypothetical protein